MLCKGIFSPPEPVLQELCRRWRRKDKKKDRTLLGMMKMLECDERPEAPQPEVGFV